MRKEKGGGSISHQIETSISDGSCFNDGEGGPSPMSLFFCERKYRRETLLSFPEAGIKAFAVIVLKRCVKGRSEECICVVRIRRGARADEGKE